MIRAIIFDCFGVLAKSGTWDDFLAILPPDIDEQAIHSLHHKYDAGKLTREEFSYRIRDLTGHEPDLIEEAVSVDGVKNVALLDYIKSLSQDYKIGLLSNISSDWITSQFLTKEEQALFDDIVLSCEVGITKPDPAIYRLACERLDVAPTETVFVDDIETNVYGAQQAGLHAILFRDLAQLKKNVSKVLS